MYNRLTNRYISNNQKSVVIIEDNTSMLSLLERILMYEFSVIPFENADQATEWLLDGNSADIIVSDIDMEGTSGIEFAKQIQLLIGSGFIPFIFLSGSYEEDMLGPLATVDYDAYIQKPFNPVKLIDKIKEVASLSRNTLSA